MSNEELAFLSLILRLLYFYSILSSFVRTMGLLVQNVNNGSILDNPLFTLCTCFYQEQILSLHLLIFFPSVPFLHLTA